MSIFNNPLTLLIKQVQSIQKKLDRTPSGLHSLYPVLNEFTPAAITASPLNDYVVGDYATLRLQGVAVNISGFTGGKMGRELKIINVGANNIGLLHEGAASVAANRIITSTGATITLGANDSATLYYDSTTARWRVTSFTQ